MTAPFDFAPLLAPGTPAPAVKWNGFPKYNFIGGHNDAKHVPVQALIEAATAVLKREGATLATYGLNSGPQGYKPLREFLAAKLKRHAGIDCSSDEILITSGSMQGLDLVNSLLLARGDTVLVEQESYGGALSKLTKLGINTIGIPLDDEGLRLDVVKQKLEELKQKGIKPKYIYTIPTVQNPTGAIMGEARRRELIKLAAEYGAAEPPLTHIHGCAACEEEETLLDARRAREKERILSVDSKKLPDGDAWFVMSEVWLKAWRDFIDSSPAAPVDGTGRGVLPPGPIDNARLLGRDGKPLPNLRASIHYRGVNKKVWEFLHGIYGGGPPLKRPRLDIYTEALP